MESKGFSVIFYDQTGFVFHLAVGFIIMDFYYGLLWLWQIKSSSFST